MSWRDHELGEIDLVSSDPARSDLATAHDRAERDNVSQSSSLALNYQSFTPTFDVASRQSTSCGRSADIHVNGMDKQSDVYRQNAENCLELAEKATSEPAMRRYRRMADAWRALAEEQDWLDGEVSPMNQPDKN